MQNRSVISRSDFTQIQNEVALRISSLCGSSEHEHYALQLSETLEHLKIICLIQIGDPCVEHKVSSYNSAKVQNYDLSTIQSVKNLSFVRYENNREYEHYSLSKWMALQDSFILHRGHLDEISTSLQAEYPREIFASLRHLANVIYIQGRHKKMDDLCYPRGLYDREQVDRYNLSTVENLLLLRVETRSLGGAYSIINPSIQEAIRTYFFKCVKKQIILDLSQFSRDHGYGSPDIEHVKAALRRLEQVIKIRNNQAKELATGTEKALFYYDEVMRYDLSSRESLMTIEVHTYHPDGPCLNQSVKNALTQLKAPRIAKSLFNALYREIMPEIHRLQELAEKKTTEKPLRDEILTYTEQLADALHRFYYILLNSNNESLVYYCDIEVFLQLDVHFECSLEHIIQSKSYCTPTLLEKLKNITVERALSQEKSRPFVVMQANMFSSIVKTKKLCDLVMHKNLDGIKKLLPHADDVNLLIDLPIVSPYHSLFAVQHMAIPMFLGRYNPLILAVCYRDYPIVAYFINTLGADPDIKGGRKEDYSARYCANWESNMLGPKDTRITELLPSRSPRFQRAVLSELNEDDEIMGFQNISFNK